MKVVEKDTDRKAEIHIYVKGSIKALEEYGEYVDGNDGAICCYVPIEEGQQPKFGGKFTGTVSLSNMEYICKLPNSAIDVNCRA